MKRFWRSLISLVLATTGLSATTTSANVPEIAINAVIFPIYKPDFDSPDLCSQSSVTVARNDQKDLAEYDVIEVRLYSGQSTLGGYVTGNSKTITRDIYTNLPQNRVNIPISLCVRDISVQYIKGDINELEVRVTYKKDFSIQVGSISTMVKVLPKTPEAIAIEKVISECDFSSKKEWNAVIEQTKPNIKKGKPVTLTGTFFRSGIPAPNDTLRLYQDFETDPKRGTVRLLSTSSTDANGVFKFTFVPKSKNGIYTVTFQARTAPIGPIHGPFDSGSFIVSVDCKNSCNYRLGGSIVDWIPKYSQTCLSAYAEYDLNFASSAGSSLMYGDNNNRIPFLYRKVFVGSKGKKSYFDEIKAEFGGYSGSGSSSSGGLKRCWVSGYTTKSGKSVSGYWRSC